MNNFKKFNDFLNESFHSPDGKPIGVDRWHRPVEKFHNNDLEDIRKEYPNALILMSPHERFKDSYYARVDIIKQDGEKEYLGALRGPVSKENALEFFKNILSKNYDKFY